MTGVVTPLLRLLDGCRYALSARLTRWTKPFTSSLPLQTLADLGRSGSELVAEHTLLRQQLIILKRQVKRPAGTKTDRLLLVLLARLVRAWKQALFIVQPDILLTFAARALSLVEEFAHASHEVKSGARFSATTLHRSGRATRFPVSDLFFRPLFAFFLIERKLTQGDPRRRHAFSDRYLGGAYRCEKRPRMGSHPSS